MVKHEALKPQIAAGLEAYYGQSGASVPDNVAEAIETAFLPKTEGTLTPGVKVSLPAQAAAPRA